MDSSTETFQTSPPRLIASIVAGFNTVANNVQLLVFPIFLDLLFWFGPHFRVKNILQPSVDAFFDLMATSKTVDMQAFSQAFPYLTKEMLLSWINLLTGLRSWPVGIPSLFFFNHDLQNPLGMPRLIEMPTTLSALTFLAVTILVGIYLGSIYFNWISNASIGVRKPFSFSHSLWEFRQSLYLAILLSALIGLMAMPVIFILTIFLLFQLFLFGLIVISFLLIWILLPLVFSAHGIFMFKLNVVPSIATSVRLVRFFLPGTGIFLVVAVLLNEGMNTLWLSTPHASWLSLIGVAGHAFIATGLLAASFVYYGSGMRWMQENLQHMAARQKQA